MTASPSTFRPPADQAQGLRRLFAHAGVHHVPVLSNPHVAFGGVLLERLCAAFGEHRRHILVVDAAESARLPCELSAVDLAACVEPLSSQVSYLAARGLPLRHVDHSGSTASFLNACADACPRAQVVLVHAPANELCRLFMRSQAVPLLIADEQPASVTHAYSGLKQLCSRAGLLVHDLLLAAPPRSLRAERIATQMATCADDFLGAVLRERMQVDPASDAGEPAPEALHEWAGRTCHAVGHDGDDFGSASGFGGLAAPRNNAGPLHVGSTPEPGAARPRGRSETARPTSPAWQRANAY